MTALVTMESADGASYEHAMLVRVLGNFTITEHPAPGREWSELRMTEPTARQLHKLLGNIIRNLDQYDSESGRPKQ